MQRFAATFPAKEVVLVVNLLSTEASISLRNMPVHNGFVVWWLKEMTDALMSLGTTLTVCSCMDYDDKSTKLLMAPGHVVENSYRDYSGDGRWLFLRYDDPNERW
jgi:hypothetical protein